MTKQELLEKALKLKAEKTGLPYTMERASELLGQKPVKKTTCECGAEAILDGWDVYERCAEEMDDRYKTEERTSMKDVLEWEGKND